MLHPCPGLEFLMTAYVPVKSCRVPRRHGRTTHQTEDTPFGGFGPDLPCYPPLSHESASLDVPALWKNPFLPAALFIPTHSTLTSELRRSACPQILDRATIRSERDFVPCIVLFRHRVQRLGDLSHLVGHGHGRPFRSPSLCLLLTARGLHGKCGQVERSATLSAAPESMILEKRILSSSRPCTHLFTGVHSPETGAHRSVSAELLWIAGGASLSVDWAYFD